MAGTHVSRRPFVGGNWKMNTDLASACELADNVVAGLGTALDRCDVAVFPPFPYLQAVGHTLGHHEVLLGAQDVWPDPNGAFTGAVSTDMLTDLHVRVVIVGHSERRHVMGEGPDLINRKLHACLKADLQVILCVGEVLAEREAGRAERVTVGQLEAGLEGVSAGQMSAITIAYEPVWAIGTGKTATPADAQAMHAVIRETLGSMYDARLAQGVRVQYGGSVKAANASSLASQPDVDGFLVGGASLKADEFVQIIRAAATG